MPAQKHKKGKRPSKAHLGKQKKVNLGGSKKAGKDVEGQSSLAYTCWYDGAINIVPSYWDYFICWRCYRYNIIP